MTRLAVITPSYEPDFGLCEDLSRSVLENSPETVHHHIIVPRRDLDLFARLAGPRTHIRCEADFLPSSFVPMPFSKYTVNFQPPVSSGSWMDPAAGAQAGRRRCIPRGRDRACGLRRRIHPAVHSGDVCKTGSGAVLPQPECGRRTTVAPHGLASSCAHAPRVAAPGAAALPQLYLVFARRGIRRSSAKCFRTFHI